MAIDALRVGKLDQYLSSEIDGITTAVVERDGKREIVAMRNDDCGEDAPRVWSSKPKQTVGL